MIGSARESLFGATRKCRVFRNYLHQNSSIIRDTGMLFLLAGSDMKNCDVIKFICGFSLCPWFTWHLPVLDSQSQPRSWHSQIDSTKLQHMSDHPFFGLCFVRCSGQQSKDGKGDQKGPSGDDAWLLSCWSELCHAYIDTLSDRHDAAWCHFLVDLCPNVHIHRAWQAPCQAGAYTQTQIIYFIDYNFTIKECTQQHSWVRKSAAQLHR